MQRWGIAAHTVKLPSGGTCSNEEAVIGLAPEVAEQFDSDLQKTLVNYWLSGILVENRLTRGPLPPAWDAGEIPPYVYEDFGTLNASQTTISNESLEVWFSNIMGCPLDVVSYTALRQ
ncbi:MAG: hypothetical protein IPO51_12040 [Dehalococcoidia bacterium]|nr:hypothetical protein [Dehalococcoidia bacterium]